MHVAQKTAPSNSTNDRNNLVLRPFVRLFLTQSWRLAPGFTRNLIKRLFFSPLRHRLQNSQKQWLETGFRFQLNVHGKRIEGWKWGRGPQILFVHGWNGRGVQLYSFFESFLRAGFSVITFDAPAHGMSGGRGTSYFEFTDVVRTFLDPEAGFDVRGIVAHSMGAAAVVNALSKTKLDTPTVLIAPALKLRQILFCIFDDHGIPEHIYRQIIAEYEKRFGYSLERDNPFELIEALRASVLIVHDRDDRDIAYNDSQEASERLSTITIHSTKGLGHRRILKDPGVVSAALEYIVENSSAILEAGVGFETRKVA